MLLKTDFDINSPLLIVTKPTVGKLNVWYFSDFTCSNKSIDPQVTVK